MRAIKDRQIIEDSWVLVADDEPLPDADAIVSFARYAENPEATLEHGRRIGIRITGDDDLEAVAAVAAHFELIALDFPKFTDGRNYSNARLLKERHGFTGELRAVGDVYRDQLFYLHRCGIDSFALAEGEDWEAALDSFTPFSGAYQPAGDHDVPVFRFRGA